MSDSDDAAAGGVLEDDEFEYGDNVSDCALSPSHKRFQTSSSSGSCKFFSRQDISSLQSSRIADLCEVLPVSLDEAFVLLVRFGWRADRVQEEWFEEGEWEIKKKSGIFSSSLTPPKFPGKCLVCLSDDVDCFGLLCGDLACVGCLGEYFASRISDGSVLIPCFGFKCPEIFPPSIVDRLIDSSARAKHTEWCVGQFVRGDFKFCPSPNACDVIVQGRTLGGGVVCPCGYSWCWGCGTESHSPASCDNARLWLLKNSSESENLGWIVAHTKPCPKCHRPIEKNQGCNHMTCPVSKGGCGTEFCWMCLSLWAKHGGTGFYNCNIFTERGPELDDSEKVRKNAKTALDKYMFYFDRFMNHGKAGDLAKTELENAIPIQMQQVHDLLGIDMAELGFLEEALVQVVKCRQVLKWSYVAGFYREVEDDALFTHSQKNLEQFTDRLHEYIERDLVEKFLPTEEGKSPSERKKKILEEDVGGLRNAFLEFRSQVCNYTAVIGNFCASIAR